MQLKLRHPILFVIACALLIFTRLPGGALLALAAGLQMALLIHGFELSKKSQLGALKIFAASVPLCFFWGGVHAFTHIYFREGQYLFFLMAFLVGLALTFLVSLQLVFGFLFLPANNFELLATLQDATNNIKNKRGDFVQITLALFVFSFVPWLSTDWKLVFSVMVTHLYLNRDRLMKVPWRF